MDKWACISFRIANRSVMLSIRCWSYLFSCCSFFNWWLIFWNHKPGGMMKLNLYISIIMNFFMVAIVVRPTYFNVSRSNELCRFLLLFFLCMIVHILKRFAFLHRWPLWLEVDSSHTFRYASIWLHRNSQCHWWNSIFLSLVRWLQCGVKIIIRIRYVKAHWAQPI